MQLLIVSIRTQFTRCLNLFPFKFDIILFLQILSVPLQYKGLLRITCLSIDMLLLRESPARYHSPCKFTRHNYCNVLSRCIGRQGMKSGTRHLCKLLPPGFPEIYVLRQEQLNLDHYSLLRINFRS